MLTLNANELTIEQALNLAKCAILRVIGDESYEICRLYHEDGVAMSELAIRHDVTRQRISQRISATHTLLRSLSLESGIPLMPQTWDRKAKRESVTV